MKLVKFAALLMSVFIISCSSSRRVVVTEQPTAPVVVRPAAPGAGYVWIDGDWYATGGRYQYRNGYWARPRRGGAWVPGHWQTTGGGYYWQRGHWR